MTNNRGDYSLNFEINPRRDLLDEKELTVSIATPHTNNMTDVSDEDDDRPKSVTLNWFIYADIYCLDYDGNVFDAALIALVAALKDCTCLTVLYCAS